MAAEIQLFLLKRKFLQVVVFTVLFFGQTATGSPDNCIIRGRVYTSLEWYGYILQKTFQQNISKIHYTISYPASECCANMLIYYDDQMRELSGDFSCAQREAILPASNNQVIPLTSVNGTAGCSIWEEQGKEAMTICVGERTFKSSAPRTWYIAISRCGMPRPLTMNYMFNISGYYGNCEEDPLSNTYIPPKPEENDKTNLHLAIAMGVIAGIAIVVSIVFITLYIISRRQMKEKPKTSGSVTSSQATMTQDIFYVNPSLSDRDHSDSQYSRSSSENYYEVIPDRRSYESINTQLALHGHHPGRTLNLASIPREHRNRIPSYIFEDIPPPPYQPPSLQGTHAHQGSHHSQGSGSGTHLLAHPSAPSSHPGGIQQIPMTSRLLATSANALTGPGSIATTTRMPMQSSAHAPMTSGNTLQIPEHSSGASSSTGPSSQQQYQQTQNSGITTSAGGLNSHNNGNTLPRSQAGNEHPIPLQNGGPVQNGVLNHGTVSRYPLHNTNHAKLLHQAYRIQQFETTA